MRGREHVQESKREGVKEPIIRPSLQSRPLQSSSPFLKPFEIRHFHCGHPILLLIPYPLNFLCSPFSILPHLLSSPSTLSGKFVRLAPNHISIADHKALNAVYGHSTGTQKSLYYDAFVPPKPFPRGLFNTRDRAEHSRKRKIVSHTFAPKR